MMMYLVEKTFIDRETKELHEKGTIYKSISEKRVEDLKQRGFLGVELVVKEEVDVLQEKTNEEEVPKEESSNVEVKGKKKGDK